MGIHRCLRLATLVLGLAAIFFLYGCGGAAGDKPIPLPDAGGTVNLTVTDAPSDQWQEVSVVLKAASLRVQGTQTWVDLWQADPGGRDPGRRRHHRRRR